MATSYKILPQWEGESWDGKLPTGLADTYQRELEPLQPRPTEQQAQSLLDADEFTAGERRLITGVAQSALCPHGEFSDVLDARRVAFAKWLTDNDRLQVNRVSDEELNNYLASRGVASID
jgi:hypothetical protein